MVRCPAYLRPGRLLSRSSMSTRPLQRISKDSTDDAQLRRDRAKKWAAEAIGRPGDAFFNFPRRDSPCAKSAAAASPEVFDACAAMICDSLPNRSSDTHALRGSAATSFTRMSIDPVGLDRSARVSGCRRDVHSPVRTALGGVVVHFFACASASRIFFSHRRATNQSRPIGRS